MFAASVTDVSDDDEDDEWLSGDESDSLSDASSSNHLKTDLRNPGRFLRDPVGSHIYCIV